MSSIIHAFGLVSDMPLYNGLWQLDNFYSPQPKMDKKLIDCYFFYYSTCRNGDRCQYRHEPEALGHEEVCNQWMQGLCSNAHCKNRHMMIAKKRDQIPCFWENTQTGCTKPHCVFRHEKQSDKTIEGIEGVKQTQIKVIEETKSVSEFI